MKKRKVHRRNPVARAVRLIRPKVVPSVKAYSRRAKHKGHSEINRNDLYFVPVAASPLLASCFFLRLGHLLHRQSLLADDADDLGRCRRDVCAGAVDGGDTLLE